MVVNGETVWSHGSVSRETHFSRSFPSPLIVYSLPVPCPFNFPNGNSKQQLSHIRAFNCYQNIDAKKKKINLHIYGIHLYNHDKTVVGHLKCYVKFLLEFDSIIKRLMVKDLN